MIARGRKWVIRFYDSCYGPHYYNGSNSYMSPHWGNAKRFKSRQKACAVLSKLVATSEVVDVVDAELEFVMLSVMNQ